MDDLVNSIDVLIKVKEAFDTRLIGLMDRTSVEKHLEVIRLRKLINKAIDGQT